MRILLANHHLAERAGSELYTAELGRSLQRQGHEVLFFTFLIGGVSRSLQDEGFVVHTPESAAALLDTAPDILHVHHAPCLFFLGGLGLQAPVVFSSLGPSADLEAPPPVFDGVARGLAVSEEVEDRLKATRFGQEVPLTVVRNWFDDLGWEQPSQLRPAACRRIAVVTNHLAPQLAENLDALVQARPGLSWTHLGLPNTSVELNAETLSGFDRVITIGRTVLLAAAAGVPCLVADVHGSDGLLSVDTLDRLARRNFSGRTHAARWSREQLEQALFDDALQLDLSALSERVWRDYSLSTRTRELLSIYDEVLAGQTQLPQDARLIYGPLGRAYADRVAEVPALSAHQRQLEGYVAHLLEDLAATGERATALEAEVQRLMSARDELEQVVSRTHQEAGAREHSLRAERDALAAALATAEERWRAHSRSLGGRTLNGLRQVKRALRSFDG